MMKLKFEVQFRPLSDTTIALKPLDCGLSGVLVYDNIPNRALAQLQPGVIVEATISLPDQYPYPDRSKQLTVTERLDNLASGFEKYIRGHVPPDGYWRPIQTAPLAETILLLAVGYAGTGEDYIGIGKGTPPDPNYPGSVVGWSAVIVDPITCSTPWGQAQTFTPTHWQSLPKSPETKFPK